MSADCLLTAGSLEVAYTATPGTLTGYDVDAQPGRKVYELLTSTDAWVAQGIADTVIIGLASSDVFTAPSHGLVTGMPVQVAALGDTAITKAWQVTAAGPVFVDLTTAINNATANDAQPFPTGEVAGDYFAVGYTSNFGQLKINVGTAGTVGTLTWEYWNGSAWTALAGVTDNTTGLTTSGSHTVVFTVPSDWATLALNGGAALYYVRAKVATAYTVDPLITQAFVDGVLPTGLSASTTYWAIVLTLNTFKLATSRANAIAGTEIDITTNGGGVTMTTVAVANAAGSGFVAAGEAILIDSSLGAKVSVVRDSASGAASITEVVNTR